MIELIFNFYQKKKSIESLENSSFCVEKKLGSRFHFLESKWTLSFNNKQESKRNIFWGIMGGKLNILVRLNKRSHDKLKTVSYNYRKYFWEENKGK